MARTRVMLLAENKALLKQLERQRTERLKVLGRVKDFLADVDAYPSTLLESRHVLEMICRDLNNNPPIRKADERPPFIVHIVEEEDEEDLYDCEECFGTGWSDVDAETDQCPACNATGKEERHGI